MRAVRHLAVAAACFTALAFAGTASAVIIPQRSIAGIELRMTRPEVRAEKGDPNYVRHGTNKFGPWTIFGYRRLKVSFQGNQGATAIFTTRRGEFTPEGIHVGSREARLRRVYPGANCVTETSDFRHCWTGTFQPGRKVTDYRIGMATGRVRSVLVAFVID